MEANEYDLVVIGSGPAGQKGAICAAKIAQESSHHRPEGDLLNLEQTAVPHIYAA